MILLMGLRRDGGSGRIILQKVMEDEVWPFDQKILHRQLQCDSRNLSYYYILKIRIIIDVICNITVISK